MTTLGNFELTSRLLLSALLGSLIGFERERLTWAAGLRTHMLVCVGSCLVMIVSAYGFTEVVQQEHVVLDPSRIAAQVVSGIGFLGAGAIILRGEFVRGLTTAASLWSVAALGLAVGGGLYFAAVVSTAIILVILAGVKPLEEHYRAKRQSVELNLEVDRGAISMSTLNDVLGPHAGRVRQFIVQQSGKTDLDEVTIVLTRVAAKDAADLTERLRRLPSVKSLRDR